MKNYIKNGFIKVRNFLNRHIGAVRSFFAERKREQYKKNLVALVKSNSVIKLHIGCGPHILKGWINLDLVYEPYENYLKYYTDEYYPKEMRGGQSDFYPMDITKEKLPFADNSVDVIFHEDFIEHIDQRSQVAFLAEALRVLKKGGIHRINTPNLLSSMRDNSHFSKGFDGVYFQEWDEHHHKSLLTPNTLQDLALLIGYSQVVFNGRNKSISTLVPKEYRPNPNDRPEDGNLFADLIK